jgi:lipoate-protein ligase A
MMCVTGASKPTIDEAYRIWARVLGDALFQTYGVGVEMAEVDRAFCSGRSDVVVEGRKIAGTAQARRGGSVVVHGTLLVDVEPEEYLAVVQNVERRLGMFGGRVTRDPTRITSLREVVGQPIRITELAEGVRAAISRWTGESRTVDA